MKNYIITSVLIASSLFLGVEKAESQVNYNYHLHYPVHMGQRMNSYGYINATSGYVNGRQRPSINSRIISSFFPGQIIKIDYSVYSEGYMWYMVFEPTRNQYGWVRGDLVRF